MPSLVIVTGRDSQNFKTAKIYTLHGAAQIQKGAKFWWENLPLSEEVSAESVISVSELPWWAPIHTNKGLPCFVTRTDKIRLVITIQVQVQWELMDD